MSNKKITDHDIELGTRSARRYLQRKDAKKNRKATVLAHNAKLKIVPFDHAAERRSNKHK